GLRPPPRGPAAWAHASASRTLAACAGRLCPPAGSMQLPERCAMLEVRDVVKTYDGRAVVNRVSFEVRPGEIFALLGPNGAGKTTLIRMITDILKPDSGTITLDGRPIGGGLKHEISYLPEERGLYRRVPVIDALSYYGRLRDMSAREARDQAAELRER